MEGRTQSERSPLIAPAPKSRKLGTKWVVLAVILCVSAFFALGFYLKYLVECFHSDPNGTAEQAEQDWRSFKALHKKNYPPSEEAARKTIFLRNREEINRHNAQSKHTYQKALYHFHDWTRDEMHSLFGVSMQTSNATATNQLTANPLDVHSQAPYSVDLRNHPCMPAVKNQGQCGSCWAFASITPLEWQYCSKYGSKISLSEQQLVDCSRGFGNNGCNGGLYTNAWVYIKSAGGIESTSWYPYTAMDGLCQFSSSKVIARISAAYYAYKDDESMKKTVAQIGPLSVALYANSNFMAYRSGVFYDPTCSTDYINHGVVIVGYGTDSVGGDYWIVRNSWGPDWGLSGYILVKRGVNQCNINYLPAFPVVA